jgi:hypothetical protein
MRAKPSPVAVIGVVVGLLVYALGRLFVVDSISFSESTHSFPEIKASLTVHAFAYGDVSATAPAAAAAATPAAPGSTTTTTTTTTASPNTPPTGASATQELP